MRKLIRPDPPQLFVDHCAEWSQQWAKLRSRNPSAQFSWYVIDGQSARNIILGDLLGMTDDHCSFCDCFPLSDRCSEAVEHFYPKSHPDFLNKAYDWDNLFYCCDKCQKSKRERFDPLLLKPDDPDYAFSDYFEFDYTTGAIMAREGNPRAKTTIEIYQLDSSARRKYRKQALRLWSSQAVNDINYHPYRDYLEGMPI